MGRPVQRCYKSSAAAEPSRRLRWPQRRLPAPRAPRAGSLCKLRHVPNSQSQLLKLLTETKRTCFTETAQVTQQQALKELILHDRNNVENTPDKAVPQPHTPKYLFLHPCESYVACHIPHRPLTKMLHQRPSLLVTAWSSCVSSVAAPS